MERLRMAGNFATALGSTRAPSIVTTPLVGLKMHPRIESSVVLPEPEGPSRVTTSPASRVKETPFKTSTSSRPSTNFLVTSAASRTGMANSISTSKHKTRIDRRHFAKRDHRRKKTKDDGSDEHADGKVGGNDEFEPALLDQ